MVCIQHVTSDEWRGHGLGMEFKSATFLHIWRERLKGFRSLLI